MTIHQLTLARQQRSETALEQFWAARQHMHRAFLHWLRTQPASGDVEAEAEGTVATVRQLAALAMAARL